MKSDLYEILQVSPNAEPEVIEAAYRRLSRKYHPDINPSPDATARMKEINQAYEILRDPQKRAMYDAQRGFVRTSRYQYPPSPRAARPSYQPPKEPQPSPPPRGMAPLARPLGAILAVLVFISCVASFLILPGRAFPSFGPTSYPTSTPYPTDTARPAVVLTPTPIGSSMPPTPTETPTPTSTSVSTALPSPSGGQETYIIVEAGETLATIAEQFDTTVEALIFANGLMPPYVIYVGQELVIPGGLPTSMPSPASTPTESYVYHDYYPIILSLADDRGNIIKGSDHNGYSGGRFFDTGTKLRIGEKITWTVQARDPQNRQILYHWDSNSRRFIELVSLEGGQFRWTTNNTLTYEITAEDLKTAGEELRIVVHIKSEKEYLRVGGLYDDVTFLDYILLP